MIRARLLAAGLALATLACAAPAHAEVRAVFVGIDTYKYSAVQEPGDEFSNLQGAVNDAVRMKATLNKAYQYGFEDAPSGTCPPAGVPQQRAITLLNQCATRHAILSAIALQTKAAHAGDTLILYLAGHGGRLLDMDSDQPGSQPSGRNSTFLPYDARNPGDVAQADILDIELGDLIDAALARGIDIVTIEDSCNSGTGTRDLGPDERNRSAPDVRGHHDVQLADRGSLPGPAVVRGRAVALAASEDDEESLEGPYDERNRVGGVFTTALVAAIAQQPGGTFIDLMTAVRNQVTLGGHPDQHPQAEGEMSAGLTPAGLGTPAGTAHVIDATSDGTGLTLPTDGAASGMTAGSQLALYATARAALDPAAMPLATATIRTVQPYRSVLALDAQPARPLPPQLYARETQHVFTRPQIALRLDGRLETLAAAADRARIEKVLSQGGLARIGEPAQVVLAVQPSDGVASLLDRTGGLVAPLGRTTAPDFATRLGAALAKLARVDDLITRPTGRPGTIALCLSQHDIDPADCSPAKQQASTRVTLAPSTPAHLVLVNLDTVPHFLAVLAIGADNSIRVVVPRRGGHDIALAQNNPLAQTIRLGAGGTGCRYLAIASDHPLDTAALVQDGTLPGADPAACGGSVERGASLRATGAADAATPSAAGDFWAMIAVDVRVATTKGQQR
ncbi:caspase family protein [Novosphingobium lentum]|uniref:caspase family protein n=1 Tax=Novosphingobium lentum TaxID=145287 RepID=UPI0008333BE5|nr:caspase family protein [Novosphingobium lentum]